MKSYNATELSYLQSSEGFYFRVLFWITAKNRSTGAPVTFGFWNGADHETITVGAENRLYYGAGNLGNPSAPMQYVAGIRPRDFELVLTPLSDEVVAATRQYDCRLAPVEIHRAFFNPASETLIAAPRRVFKGRIEEAPIYTPELGGNSACTMKLISSAISLTRTGIQMKSDEAQKLRSNDRFRKYVDISGSVDVSWGVV